MSLNRGFIQSANIDPAVKQCFFRLLDELAPDVVNAEAATLPLGPGMGKTVTLNRAGGVAVTLPPATGSGAKYTFLVGTTFTTPGTIKVTGTDIMVGTALLAQDGADTAVLFETAATSDTITLNGTTMGGIAGGRVELIDIASGVWHVSVMGAATGTEASPFSATVT